MKRHTCDRVDDSYVDTAPVRLVNTVEIKATPEQIWAALEDASAWPRWANVIRHVEWTTPEPRGVGTTRTVTMLGGLIGYEEFIAWEPYRRMAFRFNEATTSGVRAFAERYVLEPVTPAVTRVPWTMAMAPKGPSRVIVPMTQPVMRRAFGRMLKRFKILVESSSDDQGRTAPRATIRP